jgi:actin-related protein
LFRPKLIGKSFVGIIEAAWNSILLCEPDKRVLLMDNVVVTGEFSLYRGLKQRMEYEFKRFMPLTDFCNETQPREVHFGRMPEYIELLKGRSQDASWLGAAVVAKVVLRLPLWPEKG